MKAKELIFTVVFFCISVIAANAQTQFSFASGDFQHKAYSSFDPNPSPLGTFRFIAPNTDVNGQHGPFGGGTYAHCGSGQPKCEPGSLFDFGEFINGISSFYHNNTPIVVNGVTYETATYNQSWFRADANPVRIPWSYAKRKTFKLTIKVHAVGSLRINSPGPSTTVAVGGIDMWGWVTVEFTRQDSGPYPYLMTGDVIYHFPAAK